MTGHVVENWRLIAQSMAALADHLGKMVGVQYKPKTFANLPPSPQLGATACVSDSTTNVPGAPVAGGGSFTVLAFFGDTGWVVAGGVAAAAPLPWGSTGDVKLTFKTTADTGWVIMNDGSIGDGSSGATTRANADTEALFTLFYASPFTDANVPVQTSTGGATTRAAQGTAATAYAAHCRIVLPKALGRALAVAGAGGGLTNRVLGSTVGAETGTPPLSSHTHDVGYTQVAVDSGALLNAQVMEQITDTGPIFGASQPRGPGGTMSLMQPTSFFNVMVKL